MVVTEELWLLEFVIKNETEYTKLIALSLDFSKTLILFFMVSFWTECPAYS